MALSDILPQPFVWGQGGARMTPEEIAQQRKVADSLLASGMDYSPIKSPWQGAARVAQAILGGLESGEASAASKANAAESGKLIAALLGGGAAPAATTDATPAAPIASGAAVPAGQTTIPSGSIDPRLSAAISSAAGTSGVDPAYMTRLALVENGGKVEGGSPLSSATGPFQFINSTAKQYGLTNPNDPAAAADAAARLTLDNKAALTQALGREPTLGELYLAHQQGAGGAAKLLANPNAPVEQVIGQTAAANNGATPGMTAGQFASKWTNKFADLGQPQVVDANQASPLDTAMYPAGPVGAPMMAASGTSDGVDPAALPVNAQPAQGTLPTAQAIQAATAPSPSAKPAINPVVLQALTSPYVDAQTKAVAGMLFKSQMDAQTKAVDPMRALDMQTKQLAIKKAQQDLDKPSDKKQVVKIGQDGLGREQYGIFDKTDGSIKPYTPPNGGTSDPLGNTDLSGKEYLATLPKEQANTVQLMVEGKIPPPTSFAMSKPYWQNMISAAKNYDPTFDATAWAGRVAGTRDFSSGKSAEMVRSANQTLHHVGSLLDSMDKLNNGSYPMVNSVGNYIAEARGSGAQGAFRTNAHAVAEELSKVFKGNNLSDAEIRSWEQNLHENMSPEQQRTQVAKLNELLQGSLHALDEKRTASIGPMAAEKAGPIIKPEGQRVIERINNWVKGVPDKSTSAAPQGKTSSGISWSIQ